MSRKLSYIIDKEYDGKKVNNFLRGKIGISSRLVASLKCVPNGIQLNGFHARTIDILKQGDVLCVNFPPEQNSVPSTDLEIDIVYEDEDLIVINKPAGIAIHPTHNHQGDTLANAVSAYLEKNQNTSVFRAIGRLDKGTSGLVVCALNRFSAYALTQSIKKEYVCIVHGFYKGFGTIDKPIIRPDPMKTIRTVGKGGERAITHWTSIKSNGSLTMLNIHLETGRTHQIRVHFSSLGTPLVGDDMYNAPLGILDRPALHCCSISFIHPVSKIDCNFVSDIPKDMKSLLKLL